MHIWHRHGFSITKMNLIFLLLNFCLFFAMFGNVFDEISLHSLKQASGKVAQIGAPVFQMQPPADL